MREYEKRLLLRYFGNRQFTHAFYMVSVKGCALVLRLFREYNHCEQLNYVFLQQHK